jgi:hypothetical protein
MKRASFYAVAMACLSVAAAGSFQLGSLQRAAGQEAKKATAPAASASLDYAFFKAKVEPVFLATRPGHARCVVCHTINNAPFHLVALSPGSTGWTEEQSRQNFVLVQKVVVPGWEGSKLLTHPLAEHAGGDPHHGGGQQFASQSDPEWSTLKAFVLGATLK